MYQPGFYFDWLAAAFVRGVHSDPLLAYPRNAALRLDSPLECLNDQDLRQTVQSGIDAGLRLHRFKKTSSLPRVAKVLNILHDMEPATVLEVGSGHGAFLWPLLDRFPRVKVTATDKEEQRIGVVKAVTHGGVKRLNGEVQDATRLSFPDASFDVVTVLEVVEHIPEAMRALAEAVRVARRHVVVSVPSRPGVPPHTHALSSERLTEMLLLAGATRVTIDETVPDHIIAIAKVGPIPAR